MKLALALLLIASPATAASVTPSFTTGTVTSRTQSTTTVTETIKQTDFQTGFTYTATGSNINFNGTPALGNTYNMVVPGAAFQFTETYFGPGESRYTEIQRSTTVESVTDSVSVFTQ